MKPRIKILKVTSSKFDWEASAENFFVEKINRYVDLQIINIKSPAMGRKEASQKIKKEEELILKKIEDSKYIILLDEKGAQHKDSVAFSEAVVSKLESVKEVVFVIGGAYGVSDEVKKRAHQKISLSQLTMNHPLAFVVCLEQIYRALCISKGIPYHNL